MLYLSGHSYSEHILKPDILFVESPDVTVVNNYATPLQFLWIFGGRFKNLSFFQLMSIIVKCPFNLLGGHESQETYRDLIKTHW